MKCPNEINWPRWDGWAMHGLQSDPRRFRVYVCFRLPEGGMAQGHFRWAIRVFGRELSWVHRTDPAGRPNTFGLNGGYLLLAQMCPYDPDHEWHWPRPRHLREGWRDWMVGIGGRWWQPWVVGLRAENTNAEEGGR